MVKSEEEKKLYADARQYHYTWRSIVTYIVDNSVNINDVQLEKYKNALNASKATDCYYSYCHV